MKCKKCGHDEGEHCKTTKVEGNQRTESHPCFHMDKNDVKGEFEFISCKCGDFEE